MLTCISLAEGKAPATKAFFEHFSNSLPAKKRVKVLNFTVSTSNHEPAAYDPA